MPRSSTSPADKLHRRQRRAAAQTLVEAAIVFPLLILGMVGLVQFALYMHVRNVVVTSIQEGAHVAAARGDHREDGQQRALDLIGATLGSRMADRITIPLPEYIGENTD